MLEKMHDEPVKHHNIRDPRYRRAARIAGICRDAGRYRHLQVPGRQEHRGHLLCELRQPQAQRRQEPDGAASHVRLRRALRHKDETFVFWNKGDTAFVIEGKDGKETYSSCTTK